MADTPRLTVRCEYPDMPPTEVTFGLSPSYGILTGSASPLRAFRLLPYLSQQDPHQRGVHRNAV